MKQLLAVLISMYLAAGGTGAWAASDPAVPAANTGCAADLIALPEYRLGIGVLVETDSGEIHLGTSPYAGSLHNAIVDKMLETFTVNRILWMGELRYRSKDGMPEIREANETSGYYSALREKGLPHGDRDIPVSNSVSNLPAAFLSADFEGHPFDPDNMRLARELRYVKGDIRHGIGNSLQMMISQTMILRSPRRGAEEKLQMIADFRKQAAPDLVLMRWLVLNLLQEGRVGFEEMDSFLRLISLYENPQTTLEELLATDINELDAQVQKLSRIVSPHHGQMIVDLYRLR